LNPQDPLKPAPAITTVSSNETVRDQDKIMLVLSYIGILALIPFLTVKDSPFVQWHAKQGLAVVGVSIGIAIATAILAIIPLLHLVFACVGGLAQLALWVMDIVAMFKSLNGERWRIPLVADLADKF
jgi:uncharacterized membrane protein